MDTLTQERQKLLNLLQAIAQQKHIPYSHQGKRFMFLFKKFFIKKNERGLLFKEGDFQQILLSGTYHYFDPFGKISVEVFNLSIPEFTHPLISFLLKTYADEMARYFTLIDLNAQQVALISKDGHVTEILSPNTRKLYWKGFIDIAVEIIDISQDFTIDSEKAKELINLPALQQQVKTAIVFHQIPENHVGLLSVDNMYVKVLETGLHAYWKFNRNISIEVSNLIVPEFNHYLKNFRLANYPADIANYFTQIELSAQQIALVYKNGILADILPPSTLATYWKTKIEITFEIIEIKTDFLIPTDKAITLVHIKEKELHSKVEAAVFHIEVPEHSRGLLYVEEQFIEILQPGLHAYWQYNRNIKVVLIDTRLQEMEISGQEILTKDKVSLRINLSAVFVFKDILKMVSSLEKPADYLYKELQFGLRAVVGTHTLDELLENKTIINESVYNYTQGKVTEFGIYLHSVGVKDIILPGEMKTILSKVVEAEKIAQANLIRRREETSATRSLLNTAKVMEDNPTALRLKELEMLEKVTEKIGSISVYGGLEGLLKELVKIKP